MRSVILGTFVPTILFELAMGAVMPIFVATAIDVGMSLKGAALLVTMVAVGQLLSDVPAGAIAARLGDRAAMLIASGVGIAGFLAAYLATHPATLVVAILAMGGGSAAFFLARQSYLTDITHPLRRARVMSTMGGVVRIGLFFGPFCGAAIIPIFGVRAVYLLAVVTAAVGIIFILAFGSTPTSHRSASQTKGPSYGQLLRDFRPQLATLGIAILLIGAVRGARMTVLPLWAEYLGLSPDTTSVIFGVANMIDMLLFYPAGKVMDAFGRLWIGIPAMIVMGAAFIVIPLTATAWQLAAAAVLLGFGNGISSGILMTLGADIAPQAGRSKFLGIWRIFSDTGSLAGPTILTIGAGLGSLAGGIWVMGGVGVLAVIAQWVWVPKWSEHANRTTRRRAGIKVTKL
ncbi:MAG: MFS transporter [Bowdeniella nasicola]|nr:MFS transporter [Bowdeniella nasicola]